MMEAGASFFVTGYGDTLYVMAGDRRAFSLMI
jgi:hypothetical protein